MRGRVLAFKDNLLYVQRRHEVVSLDVENHICVVKSIKLKSSCWLEHSRLASRFLRLGIHALCVLEDGALLMVVKGRICKYSPETDSVKDVFLIPRGSRPLFLCLDKDGRIYFGEYFRNQNRQAVHVYASFDAEQGFDIAYTFPSGTVRHVHGVFADPYSDLLWVTTGDNNRESALWVTDDHFGHLEKVLGGTQQYRAVQLLFTDSFIYFGSDTFLEQNHLYRLERKSGQVERLHAVSGSVLYGAKVGHYLFFSTAVEPSEVNRCQEACIWISTDGENWKCIARYRKDIWPMKLFQYGQILFPSGENNTGHLWFTPVATKEDQTIQRLRVANLFVNS